MRKPWHSARAGVKVKLLPEDNELYVFAESCDRIAKERSMRRRQLKWLWARLAQLQCQSHPCGSYRVAEGVLGVRLVSDC